MHDSILDAIGNTPIVRLSHIGKDLKANLWVKCEFMNPTGSIKDRIGKFIINQAEQKGLLKPGGTIIEATSGNTGMGLAMVAAIRGYQCIFVMADKQSEEKRQALRALGAQVVICPTQVAADDPRSYYQVAARLVRETPNSFYANQYHNPDNPEAHYQSTGPEIWRQMGFELDALVVGIGTGGTVVGIARYLREQNPKIQIIGVDPIGSIYFDLFHHDQYIEPHHYLIEGIGEDFMPSTMDLTCMDDIIQVTDQESFNMTRKLITKEGLLCGGSSGAAVCGAIKYATKHMPDLGYKKLNILTILPDSLSRYLSKLACLILLLQMGCNWVYLQERWLGRQIRLSGLKMKHVQLGADKISYWEGGKGPTLLLLHGFGANGTFGWSEQVPALSKHFHVIIPDLLWFGRSKSTDFDFSVEHQTKAIKHLLMYLNVKQFDVAGISYGGIVALMLMKELPKESHRAVLVSSPGPVYTKTDHQALLNRFQVVSSSELVMPTTPDGLRRLLDIAYQNPPWIPFFIKQDVIDFVKDAPGGERTELLNQLVRDLGHLKYSFKQSHKPILLIWGSDDALFPVEIGNRLKNYFGDKAELKILHGARHAPNIEFSAEFNQLMLDFLKPS